MTPPDDPARRPNAQRHTELCASLGLPELSSPYPVSDELIERYQRDGFVACEAYLSVDELAAYGPAIREAATGLLQEAGMPMTFGGAFHQRLNLRFDAEVWEAYCLAPRLGELTAHLAGVDRMRIYHDQVLFKPPGAGATFWHQDMYFWPLETTQAMGTWLPLTDVPAAMGAMRYGRASHQLGNLGQHNITAESEKFFNQVLADNGVETVQLPDVGAGDLLVHNGWMVHGAAANTSDQMREAVIVALFPDGTRIDRFDNGFRRHDAATHLGGRAVGELADSDRNTIL